MLALQLLALGFLTLSAALFFGPQLTVYGPKGVRHLAREGQAQFVGGCFVSLTVLVFAAPIVSSGFLTGGDTIRLVMVDLFTLQFSPV
ncbi:MAG: hypothetical protein AAFV37_04870 [Pseudomonadota bacterium]